MALWGAVLMAAVAAQTGAPARPPHVHLCVLSFRDLEATRAQWAPTASRLEAALPGYQVTVAPMTYPQLNEGVRAGDCELVLTNPEHFVQLRAQSGLAAVATLLPSYQGRPLDRFGGVVVVRDVPGAPSRLADLKGRDLAAPSQESLGGYLLQRWALLKAGVDLAGGDARVRFLGMPHDLSVLEVAQGRATAAFVRTGVLEAMQAEGKLQAGWLKVVEPRAEPGFPLALTTELSPEWPLAAAPGLPRDVTTRAVTTLLQIAPTEPEAVAGRYFGFSPPGDYSGVEALMMRLHVHPEARQEISLGEVLHRYALHLVLLAFLVALALGAVALRLFRDGVRLRAAAEERHHLLASLAEGVVGLDLDGRCTFANQAAAELTGWTVEELTGHVFHDLCHHHDGSRTLPVAECPFRITHVEEPRKVGEAVFFRRDGATFPVACASSPLVRAGRLVGSVMTFTNIAERHEYQRRLAESRDAAEAASQAKSRFLAMMSHEIRTPLNGVLGMAQLMLAEGGSEAERREAARTIFESGQTLLTILNDVLDLSSIEAGRLQVERSAVRPAQAVADLHALFRHAAAAKGLRFEASWEGDAEQAWSLDASRLRQMCANLVGNAIKFTERGSVALVGRVLHPEPGPPVLEFRVNDTGPGVSAEAQARLFQPFSQAPGSGQAFRTGTGLGLSIVRQLATLMGGTAGCESVLGEGSSFWFTVSAEPAAMPGERSGQTAPAPSLQRADGAPLRVLVVDDNAVNRRVVEGLVRMQGCEVALATDGHEALAACGSSGFDLVLMDCQMPGLDGYETTRRLREREGNGRRTPIVALTASAFPTERAACREAGMDGFLAKPLTLAALVPVLEAVAAGRALSWNP